MVIFATYLGSVEMLGTEIHRQYPGMGVTVLKVAITARRSRRKNASKLPMGREC